MARTEPGPARPRSSMSSPDPTAPARDKRGRQSCPSYPRPENRAHNPPIAPRGGLQANRGGVGWVGGASSTGSTSRLRQGERPLEPGSSKNQHPEAALVSFCFYSEAIAVPGSVRRLQHAVGAGWRFAMPGRGRESPRARPNSAIIGVDSMPHPCAKRFYAFRTTCYAG